VTRGEWADRSLTVGKHVARCTATGKVSYLTRRDARIARRRQELRDGHPNAYRCDHCPYWHLGNLAAPVIAGLASRSAIYYGTTDTPEPDHLEVPDMTADTRTEDFEKAAHALIPAGQHPSDLAEAMINELLSDLDTYRFIPLVPVTPAFARRLIELNAENQRTHRHSLSDRYARDMATGRWIEKSGQTISVATNGRIINGQHRIHAVVKSGKTVHFDLNMGVDPDAIIVIDAGPGRSATDVIRTSGGRDLSGIAAIVRWVLMWEMGTPTGRGGRFAPTPMELSQRYESESDLFNTAAARGGDAYSRGLTTKAVAGTAYFLFAKLNKAVADDLFDQIVSGLNLKGGDLGAAYRLRARLIARTSTKLARHEQLALFVRAWNLYNTIKGGKRVPVNGLVISSDGALTNDNFPRLRQAAVPTLADTADND